MRRTIALLAVFGLTLLGLAAPAVADSDARPFKADIGGELFWTPDGECPITGLRTNAVGVGNATHLGKMTMTSDHCTPPELDYGVGDMVWTAANGDEIYLDYWGTCDDFSSLQVGEVLICTVEFDVVGGTGRFDDVDGSGEGYVHIVWLGITAPSMPAWWVYEGILGY